MGDLRNCRIFSPRHLAIYGVLVFLVVGGCKKSSATSTTASGKPETILEFGGTDVNADGTLSPQTLQAIEAKSKDAALSISFFRSSLSDAGLLQLSKFPNIHRVTAVGSSLTPGGIDKLKQAIPDIEVTK